MTVFLIVLALLVLVALAWLASRPAGFDVVRSRVIQADAKTIYDQITNLRGWKDWCPLLMYEPDAELQYADQVGAENGWYSWKGQRIGAGKLSHVKLVEARSLKQQIEFSKPLKLTGRVYWQLEPVEGGTEVAWGMSGEMPLLFRWMRNRTEQWFGKQYEIGLARLAMQLGDNQHPLQLDFEGIDESKTLQYIGKEYQGGIKDMPAAMAKGFPELTQLLEDNGIRMSGPPLAVYHQFDPQKDYVYCEMAVPVDTAPTGYTLKILPAGRYFKTRLHGDYAMLELAWHSAFTYLRLAKYKWSKSSPMLERYLSDPAENSALELVTSIEIPVK